MTINPQQTVREIALEVPASIRVFETLGIDYCCGGKHSLSAACTQANVPLDRAMELLTSPSPVPDNDAREWNDAPLGELAQYIVNRHHAFVRAESPRIQSLLTKVLAKHATQPGLSEREQLFSTITQELAVHMAKEELVLFPYIQGLDDGRPPSASFGSVENPIANMLADHETVGAGLAKIRELSHGYRLPDNACPTFRALYRALEDFEQDLHRHVHLENNILFPRALAAERSLEPVCS